MREAPARGSGARPIGRAPVPLPVRTALAYNDAMPSRARTARNRTQQTTIRRLLVVDALTSWVVPTLAIGVLTLAVFLNALDVIGNAPAAAALLLAVLVLGAYNVLTPALKADEDDPPIAWPALLGIGLVWIALVYAPFHRRLFAGPPLAHAQLIDKTVLPVSGQGSRFDLLVEGHMPLVDARSDRFLHYNLDVVDAQGASQAIEGEFSDRWRTRRLGRRGTAPTHLEHLSAIHVIDDPAGGDLRVQHVVVSGEKGELVATVYPHRALPLAVLLVGGVLLTLGALVFDRWLDPDGTPWATLLTTVAVSAAVIFSASGAGHPGIRDVIGAGLVGALIGVPAAFVAGWAARAVMRSGARPRRRAG